MKMMCVVMGVSRSGFYEWMDRPVSAAESRRAVLADLIRDVFDRSGRTYGYRRVHAELARGGVPVDDDLVRRLMGLLGLVPVQVKRRGGLTVPDRAAGPIPDLVGRDFTAAAPGAELVGDITQIDTGEGPLYLATVIDCFSKMVVGWSVDIRYPASLVGAALRAASRRIPLAAKAIFHSDRGSQYTSHEFGLVPSELDLRQSVGRTGICFDNAMAESFFGKLKTELVHHRKFATRAQARREVIRYVEGFYNKKRLHSGLDYRPPAEVLDEWFASKQAA